MIDGKNQNNRRSLEMYHGIGWTAWAVSISLALAILTGCEDRMEASIERDQRIKERARLALLKESGQTVPPGSGDGRLGSFFTNSLHHTGEGMRYWYEEAGGFMNITGIPYADLDCGTCHVQSCDRCHAEEKDGAKILSRDKVRDMETCLPCHSREGLTFKFDESAGTADVHIAAGMVCADCHSGKDVHGDGRFRTSMRSPDAINVGCESCHTESGGAAPAFDPLTESHSVHGDLLTCQACHVSNTTACMNCHFDAFLETGERKGNFIPMKDWVMLINHEGRVTSGSAMSLVHEGRKFLAYVPYYTHSVMPEGRPCADCHANAAVNRMIAGKQVPVLRYENGRVIPWKGVVPVIPDRLDFVFLDKDGRNWRPLPPDGEVTVQFAAFGEPLSPAQMESLAQAME
jgi:hypothetical protein